MCTHQKQHSSKQSGKTLDYAFEFKSSNLRFGKGVTREVGADLQNMGVQRVAVITDPKMATLPPVEQAVKVTH